MKGNDSLFGIIIQTLPYDYKCLTVIISRRIRETDIGCQRYIPRHFLPEIAEFITLVPNIVSGRNNRVLTGRFIKTGRSGNQCSTYVTLPLEYANRHIFSAGRTMKIGGRWH